MSFLKSAGPAPKEMLQGRRFPPRAGVRSALWCGCAEQGQAGGARALPGPCPGARGTSGGNGASQQLAGKSPDVIVPRWYCRRLLIFTVSTSFCWRLLRLTVTLFLVPTPPKCLWGKGKKKPTTQQPPNQTVFLLQVLR